jgi:phospholipase C
MLAYDDWGGWYDHVTPIQVDQFGYGPRVPVILVSPYAKSGYIDHTVLDFTSMLKFIEQNWNIAPLAGRDSNANNFLSAFNFNQAPRLPNFLPLSRIIVIPPKKDSTNVIYLGYGGALFLAVSFFSLANFRPRQTKGRDTK